MKPDDVLMEMGLAMLEDDGEPFSAGDAQQVLVFYFILFLQPKWCLTANV